MTKHSQRTRVWTESEEMRIFTQQRIRPTFIYLESDNLAPDLTGDQCTGLLRSGSRIIFLLRSGKEMRRGGCHDIQCLVTSPWPGGRCPASWLTGLVTTLPSPSPAPSLAGIHICRENICGTERELGAGWDHQEVMASREWGLVASREERGECQTVITEPDASQLQSAVMTPGQSWQQLLGQRAAKLEPISLLFD